MSLCCLPANDSSLVRGYMQDLLLIQAGDFFSSLHILFVGLVCACKILREGKSGFFLSRFSVQPGVLSCCFVEEERSGSF